MSKILIAKEAAEKALTAELDRRESLTRTAAFFTGATVIVTGFQLTDIKLLLVSSSPWTKDLGFASLAVLGLTLIFAVFSFRLQGYGHYPRGAKLWDSLKPETISDADAEEALVHMLLKTREQNALLNDARVRSLFWTGWLFVASLLLVIASQIMDAYVDSLA